MESTSARRRNWGTQNLDSDSRALDALAVQIVEVSEEQHPNRALRDCATQFQRSPNVTQRSRV